MDADRIVESVTRSGLQTVTNSAEAKDAADELVRQAITSLKKPLPGDGTVPTYGGTNLGTTQADVQRARNTRNESSSTIDEEKRRNAKAVEDQKAALDREAVAKGEEERAKQDRVQRSADLYHQVADTMGLTIDGADAAAVLAGEITKMRPAVDAALADIQELNQADNPLDWLTNQFILPSRVDAYNALATRYNAAQGTLDAAIQTRDNIANYASKGIPTITAAEAAAKAKVLQADADIKKSQADENLAKQNVTFARQKLADDLSVAGESEKLSKLQQEENRLKYQSQINAITLADTHAKRQLEAAKLTTMLNSDDALRVIIAKYEDFMGHPRGTFNVHLWKLLPKEKSDNMTAIAVGSLGASPMAAAANYFMSKPGAKVLETDTYTLMKYVATEVEKIASSPMAQTIKHDNRKDWVDQQVTNKILADIKNANDPKNIFYELSPAKMIASGAVPAGSKLATLLEPYTKTSSPVPSEMILNTISQEVQNPNEAGAIISAYYKKNIELRNSSMNTSVMGIKLPSDYVVSSAVNELSMFNPKFDLTKPAEATKWVVYQRQKQARLEAQAASNVGVP